MNSKELLETYPKAAEVVVEFYKQKFMQGATDQIKEIFGEYVPDTDTIAALMNASPRALFEVFDENGFYINIMPYPDGTFTYQVIGDSGEVGTITSYPTRIEADKNAIEAVFLMLNEKL